MSDLAERLEIEAQLREQSIGFARLQACAQQFAVDCQVKTLSYLDTNLGGALVPPPRQARISKLRRNRAALDSQGWKQLRQKYRNKGLGSPDHATTSLAWTLQAQTEDHHTEKPFPFNSVESAGRWVATKWLMLERRYGRRTALALAIAMITSAPLPGNVAAIVAAAEAVRGLHGYFARTKRFLPIEVKGSYFAECPRDADGHCKPKGEGDESGRQQQSGQQETTKQSTSNLSKEELVLVQEYVRSPDRLDKTQKQQLAELVKRSQTTRPKLVRVSREDPRYQQGEILDFEATSFTGVALDEGKQAGQIAWKSSDKALMIVEKPKRGLDVPYKQIQTPHFYAVGEEETIVAGRYLVKEVRQVTEPGTRPEYGYKVPMYVLEEVIPQSE